MPTKRGTGLTERTQAASKAIDVRAAKTNTAGKPIAAKAPAKHVKAKAFKQAIAPRGVSKARAAAALRAVEREPTGSPEWTDPDDAPELTEALLADAEVFEGNTFMRRGRGRPKADVTKEQISVRLDPDVLAKLREAGPGWQSQINEMLRDALRIGAKAAKQGT